MSGPGQLTIILCPRCGEAQLTIALNETQRVSVAIQHRELLHMIAAIVRQIDDFHAGRLDPNTLLPIKCCEAPLH